MSREKSSFVSFLNELMRRRKRLPNQLAADLDISHATVHRWLYKAVTPSSHSCRKLAEYSGVSLEKIFSITGYMPGIVETNVDQWPEFREYVQHKYPDELDGDLITVIEDLIEERRKRKYDCRKDS